ncbi:MAG: hypothetical protein VCE74_09965 [Alphaproteobacteria bacterium]
MPTVTASVVAALSGGSRALSYFLGAVVLALALAMGAPEPGEILDWAARVLGGVFIGLLSCLILATLYCWQRLLDRGLTSGQRQAWHEAGLHAANGIATLALTYTLFGISLGIGELASQNLTPETVNQVIRGLTERFSLAFMTTVIGLPVSALLRALLSITAAWVAAKSTAKGMIPCDS